MAKRKVIKTTTLWDIYAKCPVCGRRFWVDSDPNVNNLRYKIEYYQVMNSDKRPVKKCPQCLVGLTDYELDGRVLVNEK